MSVIYSTATTANGYLADCEDSLEWLFSVAGEQPETQVFMESVTALVMGSTTYKWLLRHEDLMAHPGRWQSHFGSRPAFVFTHQPLEAPEGADVRFVSGTVGERLPGILAAAQGGTVWVQGGGDLAGQFLDAGALDEIVLSVAPVFLSAGRSLLPRDLLAHRLRLAGVEAVGQFVHIRYRVVCPEARAGARASAGEKTEGEARQDF